MEPAALIVDLFGTVVPKWSSRLSREAKRRMAALAGVSEEALIESWNLTWRDRELGRISMEASLISALSTYGRRVEAPAVRPLLEVWRELVRERLVPRSGEVLETLACCRALGLRIGLVSNAGPDVPAAFNQSELSSVIDEAVFSCEAGVAKPEPEIYRTVCDRLGVDPKQCVFVGDGGDDELEGARRVGMKAVWIRIQNEIDEEGPPPFALRWRGPVISSFEDIRRYLATPDRLSAL